MESINNTENSTYTEEHTRDYHAIVYTVMVVAFIVTSYTAHLLTTLHFYTASRSLHDKMVTAMLNAPMAYFDNTPIGKTLNV